MNKGRYPVIASRLTELPFYNAVMSYEPSDFDRMTKEELVGALPGYAYISWKEPCSSWNKSKILASVTELYNLAKGYFHKHGDGLMRLQPGQLCLIGGSEPDVYLSQQPVYLFVGVEWHSFPDESLVLCHLQELSVQTYDQPCDPNAVKRLISLCQSHGYSDNHLIYPIPEEYLLMASERLENLKKALQMIAVF